MDLRGTLFFILPERLTHIQLPNKNIQFGWVGEKVILLQSKCRKKRKSVTVLPFCFQERPLMIVGVLLHKMTMADTCGTHGSIHSRNKLLPILYLRY